MPFMTDERVVDFLVDFYTCDMLVPGMWIPGSEGRVDRRIASCNVARNLNFRHLQGSS